MKRLVLATLLIGAGCNRTENAAPRNQSQPSSVTETNTTPQAPDKEPDRKPVHFSIREKEIGDVLDRASLDEAVSFTKGNVTTVREVIDVMGEQQPEPDPDDFFQQAAKRMNYEADCYGPVKPGMVKIEYTYIDDKLAAVLLTFQKELYPTMLETYTEKFGCPPHSVADTTVRTEAGIEYENQVATWVTDAGDFVLRRMSGTVTEGTGLLSSEAHSKELQNRQNDVKERLKSKL